MTSSLLDDERRFFNDHINCLEIYFTIQLYNILKINSELTIQAIGRQRMVGSVMWKSICKIFWFLHENHRRKYLLGSDWAYWRNHCRNEKSYLRKCSSSKWKCWVSRIQSFQPFLSDSKSSSHLHLKFRFDLIVFKSKIEKELNKRFFHRRWWEWNNN